MHVDRRAFILGGASLALGIPAAWLASRPAHAALRCTPFDGRGIQMCEVGLDQNLGAVTAQQEHSQWCWAACISAIFNYHGHPVDQGRIVASTYGQVVNLPAHGRQIAIATSRPWQDDRGQPFESHCEVLWDSGEFVARPDAAGQAARELAQGDPLIIGAAGHAMVLTAMSYARNQMGNGQPTQAIVRDPWPGRGRRPLLPQEWAQVVFLAKVHVVAAGGPGIPGGGKPGVGQPGSGPPRGGK
jgi:hypothetical protein